MYVLVWILTTLQQACQVHLSYLCSLALVVTGSQDKTILVHSLEEGMEGMYMEDSVPSLSRRCTCMHVRTPDSHFNNTIDLEITTGNHYSEHILVQHSQLFTLNKTVSSIPAGDSCHHGKCHATTFHSVSNKASVFTATVRTYSILRFSFTRKQFTNSCVLAMFPQTQQAVRTQHFLCVRSLVPDH